MFLFTVCFSGSGMEFLKIKLNFFPVSTKKFDLALTFTLFIF